MVIKKYVVKDVNEAMTRIRYELGADAIIISQRKVRKGGILGLFSGKLIEVTAAIESSDSGPKETEKINESMSEEDEFQKSLESIRKLMETEISSKKSETKQEATIQSMILEHNANVEKNEKQSSKENESKLSIETVHEEVAELKELLNKVVKNTSEPEQEQKVEIIEENKINDSLKEKLFELDIDERYHNEIIKSALEYSDEEISETEILRDIFERDILVTTAEMKGRVVLVGPTGVGKTTTIAKLAGRLALVEKKKVGLITIDTYRIGAIEQLKTYAEIMNIPFKVVITIKEMENAIEEMKDCDVVLIDTTGRSSKNTMQISELRAFVQKANPDCINMVISSTTKNRDIDSILKGYSELEYNNVIITKLDETTVYGSIYNISRSSNKPINYITTGQNVPEDIKCSTKEELTKFILGEESLC